MVALIGPPPSEFVARSDTAGQCFDPSGKRPVLLTTRLHLVAGADAQHVGAWIAHEDAVIPAVSLDSLEQRLSGGEKEDFIRFMKCMLKWLPEERMTAKQLLQHPWLL